jgi:hypothetical protein
MKTQDERKNYIVAISNSKWEQLCKTPLSTPLSTQANSGTHAFRQKGHVPACALALWIVKNMLQRVHKDISKSVVLGNNNCGRNNKGQC